MYFSKISIGTLLQGKRLPLFPLQRMHSIHFISYSWNPSDDYAYPGSELDDSSDGDSLSGSSGYLSNRQDEVGDKCGGLAEFESGSSVNYSFSNFSFKNLSQLASINYDLLSKGWKDDHPLNSRT